MLKNTWKLLTITFLISLISFVSVAQKKTDDVIYLKNGSIIRGKIVEIVLNETVKVETTGGSIWIFKTDEVEKITKEPSFQANSNFKEIETGYYCQSEFVGLLVGGNSDYYNSQVNYSFLMTNGFQFKNKCALGIAIGFETLGIPSFPILIDAKYDLLNKSISPYFRINGGYSVSLDGTHNYEYYYDYNYKGGIIINPEIGIRKYFNNSTALTIGFGYRWQNLYSERYDDYYKVDVKRLDTYNRLNIRFGFIFR